MLHDDGFCLAFTIMVVWFAGAKNTGVDVVINRGEASDENRIDGGNTSVWRSDYFAGAEFVADGFKNESHAEAGLKTEMPIFCISIR